MGGFFFVNFKPLESIPLLSFFILSILSEKEIIIEKPFFITTPIYYINSTPHVGHAYTQIAADARARFERLRGREVYFLTGTDENALKVARVAVEQGKAPLEFCDELRRNGSKFGKN